VKENLVSLEALRAQVAEETLEFAVVGDPLAAAHPLLQGGREQRIWVDVLKHLVNGSRRDRFVDARRLDLLHHASSSSITPSGLRSRNGAGDAFVVDAAFGFEPAYGLVD